MYNTKRNTDRGACVGRLRGSNRTSTLSPDADNAAVGSHTQGFFTGGIQKDCLLFLFYNVIHGELVVQAERKVQPSTHIPDLDNANVGTFVSVTGSFRIGGFPYFYFGGVVMVKVNDTELDLVGKTVSEYLATTNYDLKRIAVERNGDIVLKSQYDVTILKDGDRLEIVSFVGGG